MFTFNSTRSFTTIVLATATSILLAFGSNAQAQQLTPLVHVYTENQANAIVKGQTQIQNTESSVSAAELLQHEVTFIPASVDMNALKRTIDYPKTAFRSNVSGRFELIVYVGSNGTVNSVNFVTERPENNAMNTIISAACEAVKKSQFTPAMLNKKLLTAQFASRLILFSKSLAKVMPYSRRLQSSVP